MTVLNTSKPALEFFSVVRCPFQTSETSKAAMPKGHGGFPLCPVLCRAGRWPWVLQRNMYLQRSDGKKSGKFADTKIYYIILHYIAISYVITLINENDQWSTVCQYDSMTWVTERPRSVRTVCDDAFQVTKQTRHFKVCCDSLRY